MPDGSTLYECWCRLCNGAPVSRKTLSRHGNHFDPPGMVPTFAAFMGAGPAIAQTTATQASNENMSDSEDSCMDEGDQDGDEGEDDEEEEGDKEEEEDEEKGDEEEDKDADMHATDGTMVCLLFYCMSVVIKSPVCIG